MVKSTRSVLELYMDRVFKILMIFLPLTALLAGVSLTTMKFLGQYGDEVPWIPLIIFDASNVFYLLLALWFAFNCEDKNKVLKPKFVTAGKIFIFIVEGVQWNYISYLVPSRDFWGFALFFISLTVFFLDSKFTLAVTVEIVISTVISWIIKPDVLLPLRDDHFIPNVMLRCIILTLGTFTLCAIAYGIEKHLAVELENLADYDSLTRLYNRRTLDDSFNKTIFEANKNGTKFSMLMCDLDDFKLINDSESHACGDELLKNIARIMERNVSTKGKIFRYGGEEMLILLKTDLNETKEIAERIRKEVEESYITYNEKQIKVTITIGGVIYSRATKTLESMVKVADQNLYSGKNTGKNKVIVS